MQTTGDHHHGLSPGAGAETRPREPRHPLHLAGTRPALELRATNIPHHLAHNSHARLTCLSRRWSTTGCRLSHHPLRVSRHRDHRSVRQLTQLRGKIGVEPQETVQEGQQVSPGVKTYENFDKREMGRKLQGLTEGVSIEITREPSPSNNALGTKRYKNLHLHGRD